MSHVPGIVSNVAEHGQSTARVIGPVKIRRDGPLAEIGKAIRLSRLSFGFTQCRQEQSSQNGDDGDHNQQLHERKSAWMEDRIGTAANHPNFVLRNRSSGCAGRALHPADPDVPCKTPK